MEDKEAEKGTIIDSKARKWRKDSWKEREAWNE